MWILDRHERRRKRSKYEEKDLWIADVKRDEEEAEDDDDQNK